MKNWIRKPNKNQKVLELAQKMDEEKLWTDPALFVLKIFQSILIISLQSQKTLQKVM